MSKSKKARAREHRINKMTKKMVKNHVIGTTPQLKKLAWLCNQWVHGRIR